MSTSNLILHIGSARKLILGVCTAVMMPVFLGSSQAQVSSILQQQTKDQQIQLLQESVNAIPLIDLLNESLIAGVNLYIQEEGMRSFRRQYTDLLDQIELSEDVGSRILGTVLTNYLQVKYPQLEQYHEERSRNNNSSTEYEKESEFVSNIELNAIEKDADAETDVVDQNLSQREITVQQLDTVDADRYEFGSARIDQNLVRAARQSRINTLRASRTLASIEFDPRLHLTALDWSESMKEKGTADHKRFSNSAYYNYRQLVDRFGEYGIEFTNVQRATFTENVGYATMRCTEGDCTDKAIESLRYVYEYFRSEEGQTYDAHRRTMIHPLFSVMGTGITVDEQLGRIYITIHYGTEIID